MTTRVQYIGTGTFAIPSIFHDGYSLQTNDIVDIDDDVFAAELLALEVRGSAIFQTTTDPVTVTAPPPKPTEGGAAPDYLTEENLSLTATDSQAGVTMTAVNSTGDSFNSTLSSYSSVNSATSTEAGVTMDSTGAGDSSQASQAYIGANSNSTASVGETGLSASSPNGQTSEYSVAAVAQDSGTVVQVTLAADQVIIGVDGGMLEINGLEQTGVETPSFTTTNAPVANLAIQAWLRVSIGGVEGWVPWFSTPV